MELLSLITIIMLGALFWMAVSLVKQGKKLEDLSARINSLESPTGAKTADEKDATSADAPPPSPATAANISAVSPKAWPTSEKPNDQPERPSQAFVFTSQNLSAVTEWLKEKWFFAVAALSLVLAGVFLVQYGVENGLLTPVWRVIGTLILGAALVSGGEFIRRRADDETGHAAALPSTLSGAGIVVLFTGVLSARQMYGLIGAETAFLGLVAVSSLSLVFGWFYGPLLSAVGLIGASFAPFLIGGASTAPNFLYAYFTLICLVGLSIDTVKRRAWVSVISIVFPYFGATLLYQSGSTEGTYFLGFSLLVAVGATAIPLRSLRPNHTGASVGQALWWRVQNMQAAFGKVLTVKFPTRLAFGAFLATFAVILWVGWEAPTTTVTWVAIGASLVLFWITFFWLRRATALWELPFGSTVVFLALISLEGLGRGPLYSQFSAGLNRPPETALPTSVFILVALGVAMSCVLFGLAMRSKTGRLALSTAAAFVAPATLVSLEAFWQPARVYSEILWASIAMLVAALMVGMAHRVALQDRPNKRRAALFAMSALSLVSFALVIMLSDAALTVAFAVVVLLAAIIDRKFDMWLLAVFVQVGTIAIGYRSFFDPGLWWIGHAPTLEFLIVATIILGLLAATWVTLKSRDRGGALVVVESAFWSLAALFASVALSRLVDFLGGPEEATVSLAALVLWISAANQLYRAKEGARIVRIVRLSLAWLFGLFGGMLMIVELVVLNPVWGIFPEPVAGPLLLNSLIFSYGGLALIFGFIAWKMTHLKMRTRKFNVLLGTFYTVLFVGLEIRHLWWGSDMEMVNGVLDGELYSYTIAMLLSSAALLFYAFSRRNLLLRRFAMIGIGLTIAKVFLIDMSGLAGLIRVASFLGLGLSLAALAWINGNMTRQWDRDPKDAASV